MASRPTSASTAYSMTRVTMKPSPATSTNQATTTTTTTTTAATAVLKKQTPTLNHYMGASTPIAAHYQLNAQILYAFDVHYQFKRYQVAHALGLQFVETALVEIPKHGYYYSNRHERERGESIRQAKRVLKMLNKIPTKDNRKKSTSSIPSNQPSSSQSPPRNQQQQQLSYGIPSSEWDLSRLQKLQDLALAAQHVHNNKNHHKSQSLYEKKREAVEQAIWGHPLQQDPPSCPPLEQKPLTKAMASVDIAKTKLMSSMSDSSYASTTTTMTTGAWSADDAWLQKALFLSGFEIVPSASKQPSIVEAEAYEYNGDNLDELSEYDEDEELQRTIAQEINEGSHVSAALAAKTAAAQRPGETTTSTSGNIVADIAVAQRMVQEMSAMADDSHTQKASSPIFQSVLWPQRRGKATTKFSHAAWELDTLCQMYRDDFDSLLVVLDDESSLSSSSLSLSSSSSSSSSTLSFSQDPRIQIRYCPTYQGRLSGSTNGCTVIASLLCIHHLCQQHQKPRVGHSSWRSSNNHRGFFPNFAAADGLHNKTIQQVIDKETPIMLQQVRKSLGLPDHAFLIPADVHDYLIAHGRLHRSQFVTVVGGNVLNDRHLDNFVTTLEQFGDTNEMNGLYPREEKVAATLFFNEHVVAILKITPQRRQKQGQNDDDGALSSCYDVIDSLPGRTTVRRALPANITNNTCSSSSTDSSLNSTAIYRCSNAESLKACLRWYACSKFTKANRHYINNYEWNDHGIVSHDDSSNSNCFDPRIFQAYIWKNPTTQ